MPDALPPATPSEFTPIDFGTWSSTPEAARIEDPLAKVQAYDNRLRKDLFKAGLYDAEAEDEIINAGADQALRAGHITDKSQYAPTAKPRDPNFLARQLVRQGDTAKAQDIYRYASFLGRPDTDPETLERARVAAEVDPDTENELVRKAVRAGELPFAVVPDKDGNAIFEIDPELGALDRQQILDLAGDDIDPRFLPDLEKQLTRVPGTNYTPSQFRQAGVFDNFLKEQKRTDEFLHGELENAQDEYNRFGQLSTETQESLDRTLAALDVDNEFAPATRSRLIRDTIKRGSKPEAFDPENPQQHVQYLEDGTVWLPEQVIFDQAKHDQVLDSLSVTPEQKEAAKKLRAGRLESIAPAMVDALGADPDALDFWEKSKAAGKSDVDIATEWYSKPENYSFVGNRARSFGMSLLEAGPGLFQSIGALAGSESAMASLKSRAEDTARNEEYARLFGDSYGVGQSLLNTSSQVAVDLLAGLAVSAVATPVAGAAVIGSRAAASSLVRSLARTALTEGARSTAAGFLRSGAGSAARTLATMGDDVATSMARSIAGQTGVAASSFTRSAGSAYVQAYSALDAQTNPAGQPLYSDEEKRKIALGTAMTAGTATAAITLGFGKILGGGVEDFVTGKIGTGVLKRIFGVTDDQIVAATRSSAMAILKSAGAEAPEEAADQLVGNVIQALGTGEEFRLGPALKEALEAGLVGGLLGTGTKSIEVGIDKFRSPKVVALEKANAPASAAALEARNKAAATTPAAKPTVINQDGLRIQENPPLSPDPFSYGTDDVEAPGPLQTPSAPPEYEPGDLSAGYGDEPAVGITNTAGAVRVSAAEIEGQVDAVDVQLADLKIVPASETEGQKVRRTRRIQELNAEKTRLKAAVKNAKASGGFVLLNTTNTTAEQAALTAEAEVAALDEEIATLSVAPAKETKAAATKREASLEKVRAARAEAAAVAQTRRAAAPVPRFAEGQSDPRALDYGAGGELTVQDNPLGGTPAPRARAASATAAPTSARHAELEKKSQTGALTERELEEAKALVQEAYAEWTNRTVSLPVPGNYEWLPATFVRFGDVPTRDGVQVSSTGFDGGVKERGVSVFAAWADPATGKFVLQTGSGQSLAGVDDLMLQDRPVFIVTGDPTGRHGSDGEPLLKPGTVKTERQISFDDIVNDDYPLITLAGTDLEPDEVPTWAGKGTGLPDLRPFTGIPLDERFAVAQPGTAPAIPEDIIGTDQAPEPPEVEAEPAPATQPARGVNNAAPQLQGKGAKVAGMVEAILAGGASIDLVASREDATARFGLPPSTRKTNTIATAYVRTDGTTGLLLYPGALKLSPAQLAKVLAHERIHLDQYAFEATPEGEAAATEAESVFDKGSPNFDKALDSLMRKEYPSWDQLPARNKLRESTRAAVEGLMEGETSHFKKGLFSYIGQFLKHVQSIFEGDTAMTPYVKALVATYEQNTPASVPEPAAKKIERAKPLWKRLSAILDKIDWNRNYATSYPDLETNPERFFSEAHPQSRLIDETSPLSAEEKITYARAKIAANTTRLSPPSDMRMLSDEASNIFKLYETYRRMPEEELTDEAVEDLLARKDLNTFFTDRTEVSNAAKQEALLLLDLLNKIDPGLAFSQAYLTEDAPPVPRATKAEKPTDASLAAEMRAGKPIPVHETLFNDTVSQGWVPTRNVLLSQLKDAGFGGQVYGKAFAATAEAKIQELYPVTDVSKQKGVVFPTLDSLGFGDIKGPDGKTVKIPVFADDNTSGPFTNDPQTTAWQKNAGLSIKVPAGVAVNPAIKVNPRTGFVDYSTHNSGARIYAKGDFKRAGNTIGSYLAFQNKQGFGASLETLPPFDSSKLAGPVDFAGMRIIPGVTTEDDILRFYFAPSSDGGPSKIESAINASASGMSAVDKDQVRAAAQLSFIRELREFTLDMSDVGSVDPKGFLRTPDGYKAGIENRIANVWSKADRGKDGVIDTSEHWNERGRPSHLAFFVKDSIRNHEKANERRPDANVQLGSDDVDQATALERAAARNDADNAGDMLVALDEAFTPEVLRGSAAIMGMPPETGIVNIASGVQILVSRIDSVPALRKAFEQAYLATLDLPPGPSAKRAVAIQKAKAMASDELVVLASRSALVQPGVVQAVRDAGFFKSLSYGLNTFTDTEIAQHRADNRAAVADLQLDGDLRSAIERIARSAKYPRRYRAVMLAALKMQVLPNISIVDAPAEAYAGSYLHSGRLITLNLASSNGRGLLDVLAHELLHAATLEAIANPQTKAAKELLARLERARQKAAEVVPSDMSYAVSSIDEFITHAATDPRLQVILRETFEKGKTTWQRVVDAIAKFFGIANPDFVSDLWGFINHAAEYGLRPGVAASREQRSMPGTNWARRDAEYLAAVESGDLETAQRLVDVAARDAGYTTGPVWHGTSASNKFTVFQQSDEAERANIGFHFGSKEQAIFRVNGDSGRQDGRFFQSYLKGRMVRIPDLGGFDPDAVSTWMEKDKGWVTPEFTEVINARLEKVESGPDITAIFEELIYPEFTKRGFDGIVYSNIIEGEGDSYAVFNPSQIKSADPVTRDDAGNVIPLSARFRPSSPDIRYSMPAPAPATEPTSTLLEDTKAKTVAGTTVGTRNPTSKTAAESGTDPKALVDRASMRRDPELYRKNAVMLADFPLVAGQVPEAAQMVRKIKAPVIEAQAAFDAASAKLEKTRAELKAELARRAGVRATAIKIAEVDKLEAGETKIARGDTAIRGMLRNIEQARKAQEKARDKRTAAGETFKAASKTLMAGNRFPIELADRVYDAIETAATRNLELLIELFPAALRDTARLWYDGANIIAQEFAAQFGTTLNRSSAVLAVFSPQKDWFMNVALAKRMMNVWAKHQNTPFDGQMAAQYLKRAGEPEPVWDKKAGDFKKDADGNLLYTKGAKPVLDDEGNITGWANWSAESAREKFEKAEEDLAAMRGKTLAELPIEFQARFIRMWSEIYDSANFPIVSPDGSFGDNKLSEKGNPQRIAWGSYVTIEKAIAIMTAPEADEMQVISDELGVQHKVRSFYNNIVDPANTDGHVTMDTHAIAAILWQALSGNSPEVTMNFGGGGASGSSNLGVSGLYPAFAEAYRKVAAKFGLLPREIQSITWESVRLLFPAKFKSQKANVEKVREIWRMHELNLLTTQQAHDRIFQIVDEWKRRSSLAGQPGRTATEAVADGTGVGDPDWAEIARRGQNNSGAPPVAPDAGGLPASGRRGNGAGRPTVGRRGAGRDAGLLPGSAAGDQPGSVLGALTPEGAALDGSRGSVDQFLPTLPAGVSYSFDDTRPKYLAFARRSQPGVVTVNKQALAAVIAGLSPANARAIVSKIVKHEIAHLAAFSTFTDADISEMARGMSAHEINEVARRYYDSPDALARLEADLESGAITNEAIVEEYLRMQLELATDGSTTEATIAFHSNNPGFVARMVKYLKDALVALWRNVAGPQEDFVNRVAISRLAREYRAILRGHAPLRAEPLDPADPNRDTRAALAPQSNTDPDGDAAIREIFTESVEDFTKPYEPGSLWRRLFVVRTGDRRFPAISDKRQSSLVANERLVFGRRKQLNKTIAEEKPDAQVLAAAAGDTSPTTTPEQDTYIAEEFAAAMEDARQIEDPAAQATAIAEAYELKQRLTTAAYVETARIKKRRIDEAFAELERTAPKTAANLKAMREGIDNISRIVKEYQPDASPLRMVLGTQEGIYLTRVYKIHHKDGDPLSIFSDPAMADVRERAQDQLMESFIQYRTAEIIEQEAEAGKIIGEAEAREVALKEAEEQDLGRILLEDYLLSHGSKALPHNGTDFRTDLTRFFKKMPVPEALRDVLEEVKDPVELLTRTGLNVGMLAASTVFTRDLARGGYTSGAMVTGQQWAMYRKLIQEPDKDKYLAMLIDGGWAKRQPTPGYVEIEQGVHIPAWLVKAKEDRDLTYVENFRKVSTTTKKADAGKLADLYAHPNVADWMDHVFAKQKAVTLDDAKLVQKMGEVFAKATGTSLGIATLGSVGFYTRNLVGTAFFLAANGINPFSAKSARASKLAVEAFLNRESGEVTKLTGLGVLNDDLRPETIKELLKGETDRPGGLNILELIGRVLGGKKGIEYGAKTTAGLAKLAELATAIDGIAKATAYYAELETMREAYPSMSAKWHEDEAAKVVKLTHQAKSQTPPIIDSLTSSSYGRLMSPYLRFKGEMFRLTGNIIAQSAAEIRSDNPAIRARGYKRAAGFAMISAFSVAGPALISAMYGVGDDEEFALRKALPSYLRGNSIIYIPSDDGKSVTSLDFTYLNPYSFIGDPISRMGRAVMRGEPGDGVDELAIWMNSSFLSEQILAGAAMEVLRNKTSDDKPITFETDSADEKLIKFSKHLVGSSFTPQSLKAIQRSYDTARRGTPDDTPFFETAPGIIIGHGMPIRPRAFETEALALRAARTQAETNRQVRALAGQLKRRINFTEGDIEDIVADLQDSTASLNQDIARMIAGYRGLGLGDAAIAKQLVEAGRSREFARAIVFRGIAAGPSITPATRRDMFEAGEKAGGPGGGEKRTRAVAEAMSQYEKVQQVRVVPQD